MLLKLSFNQKNAVERKIIKARETDEVEIPTTIND